MAEKKITAFERYSKHPFQMAFFCAEMAVRLYPVMKEMEKNAPIVNVGGEKTTFPDDMVTGAILHQFISEVLDKKAFSEDWVDGEEDAFWNFRIAKGDGNG